MPTDSPSSIQKYAEIQRVRSHKESNSSAISAAAVTARRGVGAVARWRAGRWAAGGPSKSIGGGPTGWVTVAPSSEAARLRGADQLLVVKLSFGDGERKGVTDAHLTLPARRWRGRGGFEWGATLAPGCPCLGRQGTEPV